MKEEETIKIEEVSGVEGNSLYVNDYRVAGSKPWGGGSVVKTWRVKKEHLLEALKSTS